MEDTYIVNGGRPIKGEVKLSGAKNLALKAIIASLMFEGKVELHNVPRIRDVEELLNLVKSLGVAVHFEQNTLHMDITTLTTNEVDLLYASQLRVSFMLFAPLMHRFGSCRIPNPGGCRLGARSIDRIVEGLSALGATIEYDSDSGFYEAVKSKAPLGTYTFNKPSHTGTELLLMFAALGEHKITIKNAALEPEIDELVSFLNECGARIVRSGSTFHIEGVKALKQTKPFTIFSDRNEAVTFAALAVAGRGSVRLTNIAPHLLESFIGALRKTGSKVECEQNAISISYSGRILPSDVVTGVHPGFMTDWQPNWTVLMTQAQGDSTVHETIFENRFAYVDELVKLGADIDYIDPNVEDPQSVYQFNYDPSGQYRQMVRIHGGAQLHAGALHIHDLRAGAALLVGALIAQGESVISNASMLERGYERIEQKIQALGGDVKRA